MGTRSSVALGSELLDVSKFALSLLSRATSKLRSMGTMHPKVYINNGWDDLFLTSDRLLIAFLRVAHMAL